MNSDEIEILPIEERKQKVYTVSMLNREIRALLESSYRHLWVEAEISNFKHHTSGHIYLTLKDDKAQISAVFFNRNHLNLKFQLKDGLKVIAFGKVSVYEPRGQYQFYIERIEPKGIGALQLAFQQLKEKLEKEGLFDPRHKKPIPTFPKTVGIVTSRTGAAIRDILNVMNRRFAGTAVLLYPVPVQGEGAAEKIAKAIEEMNQRDDLDVLIVGRGGGSLEDLWAFNEEVVARAVYASRIPIISAVGHEIDWTICDLVADLRAPTPSAAAELVVQNSEELRKRVREQEARIKNVMINLLATLREKLEMLQTSYAFRQPMSLVQQFQQRHDELLRQMQNYMKSFLNQKRQSFQSKAGELNALSPLAILERGYSITFLENGDLLKKANQIRIGDNLKTRFSGGLVHAKVQKIDTIKGE